MNASGGSELTMESAYIDHDKSQAICCWNAPDKGELEGLFTKAGVKTESIDAVSVYTP